MLLPNSSDVCPTDRIVHRQPVNTLRTLPEPGSCLTKTQVLLLPLHYSFFFFWTARGDGGCKSASSIQAQQSRARTRWMLRQVVLKLRSCQMKVTDVSS